MLIRLSGFLIGALAALPLTAGELTTIEPLTGAPQTLWIAPALPSASRSAMEIWLTDALRGHRYRRPDAAYISSRQWLSIGANYETAEFGDAFRKRAEYVLKGEQLFQEALVASGQAEKFRTEGKVVIFYQANYASLKNKPLLPELFLNSIDILLDGYHSPQTNDCAEAYGCQFIIRFRPGSLEPDTINIEAVLAPASPIPNTMDNREHSPQADQR